VGRDKIHGVLYFGKQGRAKVVIEGKNEPIALAKGYSSTALHGDTVELTVLPSKKKKFDRKQRVKKAPKLRYEVRKIVKRGTRDFLGYLRRDLGRSLVQAENSRLFVPFKILGDDRRAEEHDKVLAQFVRWDPPARIPMCKILRVLGPGDDPLTDHKGILAKYGLNGSFPDKVTEEASKCPEKVTAQDIQNRRDMRNVFTLTIDPLDARDFDDALSIQELQNGDWEIGVHIADVSHYVKQGTQLSGICSLVEGEERLVKSVLFVFSAQGKLLQSKLAESVILSDKRLTYEQAGLFLKEKNLAKIRSAKPPSSRYSGNPGKSLEELNDQILEKLQLSIRKIWEFASLIRGDRMKKGALDLESMEVKILVDQKGQPEKILQSESDESHHMIEEFMLLANETVARELRKQKLPGIFRVHPDPDPENLEELRSFLQVFGISCGELTGRKEVTKMLNALNKHPLAQVLRIKFLRSLKQACYRSTTDGHYGLAKNDYLHFTSPIRRYSDLVVHRIIENLIRKQKTQKIDFSKLEGTAKHLSITERNSVDAERESIKDKLLLYYKKDIGKRPPVVHQAIITEISPRGFFIELVQTLARGFVPIRTLPRELGYRVSSNGTALVGRNPKIKLKLGQEIGVSIDKVFVSDKQLDFRLS